MRTRFFVALLALTLVGCSEAEPLVLADMDGVLLTLSDVPEGWIEIDLPTEPETDDDPCNALVYDNGNFVQVEYTSDDGSENFAQSIAVFSSDDAAVEALAAYASTIERCNAGTEEERDGVSYDLIESADYLDDALVGTITYSFDEQESA